MELVQPIRDKNKIAEIKDILRRQSLRDWFLFVAGINTGLRISDLLQLKVNDVRDKTHIVIKEKKTGKDKRFRINAPFAESIEYYTKGMNSEGFLFPSRKGDKPITRVQAYRILDKVAKSVGLEEIGCHTLRKTFGYHFYQQTKDVALLQEIFNHSAPSVTMRYIGINQDVMDKAIDNFSL
ncbi:site-specific integrase [Bacillus cereus]|uniref:Site-specific integrase n=1 Tax=Bacillus cereus TaxID=1396 RepID=A0AA44TEW7_BACCE|nr:site-specific integrase [Bacillus cereus]PFN09327.1 site-specific integrase [Bacillus cereus]PFS02028.1 site-specific integrase [Bacillus cereus]